MHKTCAAGGCLSHSVGFSNFCSSHRKALGRNGHQDQTSITCKLLKPYVAKVVARQTANPNSPAWGILEARWESLQQVTQQTLSEYHQGKPSVTHEVTASHQLLNLSSLPAGLIVRTCLAMYLMANTEPRRFRSDRAFDFQLVRRVRALAAINSGSYWDPKLERVKRVYRDLSPRAIQALAGALKGVFGGAGVQFAAIERELMSKEVGAQRRLAAALEELQ